MPIEDPRSNSKIATQRTRAETPSWTTARQAIGLFGRGATFRTAAPVAIIVGTVLSLVNQLHVVIDGSATWATWTRVAINYTVPYIVASIGFLSACRAPREP